MSTNSGSIHVVCLAGGSGTRLWPLSRAMRPKQFAAVDGARSLFRQTLERLRAGMFAPPIVITSENCRFMVLDELEQAGIDPRAVFIEPQGHNTAPPVLAAALHLARADPDALMLVAPSDHRIENASAFHAAVEAGVAPAREGQLVTFGIRPDRPETGYGYLELSAPPEPGQPQPLARFVEKPSADRARQMLANGNCLWNAGIFLFSARAIIDAFHAHAPRLVEPVAAAVDGARRDLGFLRLEPKAWLEAEDISIDHAVMEKADNLAVVPFDGGWSDLGDWQAVARVMEQDANGNALSAGALALECSNTMLRGEDERQQLVGIGLRDLLVVSMPDAVLVADRRRAQDVKRAVEMMKAANVPQATQFPGEQRPWGHFECLGRGEGFQIKRLVIKPGGILSLQSHRHRAEHWIILQGVARITLGRQVKELARNESIYIPAGEKHRLENPGSDTLVLIEVQTGEYIGDDDITRYEDIYSRS